MASRPKKTRTEQINIRLTPEEKEMIQGFAEAMEITITQLMVEATYDKMEKETGQTFKGTLRRFVEGN